VLVETLNPAQSNPIKKCQKKTIEGGDKTLEKSKNVKSRAFGF